VARTAKPCRWAKRCEGGMGAYRAIFLSLRESPANRALKLRSGGLATLRDLGNHTCRCDSKFVNKYLGPTDCPSRRCRFGSAITGENCLDLLPLETAKGFSRLPDPDDGRTCSSIWRETRYFQAGLEYLFGFHAQARE